ncbi:MAG: YdcF family protein [Brevinemataceae bacterium]
MKLKIIIVACSLTLSVFIVLMTFITLYNPKTKSIHSSKLIVILGAGFQYDGVPVLALEKRLNKALEVWNFVQLNYNTVPSLAISGRKEEVQVMKNFLLNAGISQKYIIEDTNGFNTMATVANTKKLLRNFDTSPIFISQAYHLPRIKMYAWYYNLPNSQYIESDRVPLPLLKMFPIAFRETVALLFSYPFFLVQNLF